MRAFANIEPVESTEKFWRTFFLPAGCFRIVCVTKDFTSEKIKELMEDYAPENAKYVCEIPDTTVEDVYAGTIEAVCNHKETTVVIDFTNLKKIAEERWDDGGIELNGKNFFRVEFYG